VTTTILDGETYPEALQRRYAEEAAIEKRINIIELVKEAGAEPNYILLKCEALERFAAIVSEATKEKAAKVCDKVAKHYITNNKEQEQVWLLAATSDCAAAIRSMK